MLTYALNGCILISRGKGNTKKEEIKMKNITINDLVREANKAGYKTYLKGYKHGKNLRTGRSHHDIYTCRTILGDAFYN